MVHISDHPTSFSYQVPQKPKQLGKTNRQNPETQQIGRTNRRNQRKSAADLGGFAIDGALYNGLFTLNPTFNGALQQHFGVINHAADRYHVTEEVAPTGLGPVGDVVVSHGLWGKGLIPNSCKHISNPPILQRALPHSATHQTVNILSNITPEPTHNQKTIIECTCQQ